MTRNFRAAFRELFFSDIPAYFNFGLKWLAEFTAPARDFAIARALFLTFFAWLILLVAAIQTLPFGEANPLSPSDWIGGDNVATDLRDYFWAWSFPLGALLVSLTLVNALRRTRIMEMQAGTDLSRAHTAENELQASVSSKRDELNASTFNRSAEMLASDKLMVRLGAIYSLEELMRSAFRDPLDHDRIAFGQQIGDTLAAFLRTNALATTYEGEIGPGKLRDPDNHAAFLSILRSWPAEFRDDTPDQMIDLSRIDFSNFQAPAYANFSRIRFAFSNFRGAIFDTANFSECDFYAASLELGKFNECDFESVSFAHCKMQEFDATHAHFRECDFSHSLMWDSALADSIFDECDWSLAQLNDADISNSEFSDIWKSPEIEDNAYLEALLTREQLSEAAWPDGSPVVPDRLLPLPERRFDGLTAQDDEGI